MGQDSDHQGQLNELAAYLLKNFELGIQGEPYLPSTHEIIRPCDAAKALGVLLAGSTAKGIVKEFPRIVDNIAKGVT